MVVFERTFEERARSLVLKTLNICVFWVPDTLTVNDAATTSGQSINDTGSSVDDEQNSNPRGSSLDPFSLMSGISEVLNLLKILGDGHRNLHMYNCQVLYQEMYLRGLYCST